MMTQLFELRRCEPEADPATPENRLALARRLLVGAIRRYDEACEEWSAVYESYPPLDQPREPSGPAETAERRRWKDLLEQADESFDNAELNLAERMHRLFSALDPEGRCGPREAADYFKPRAVRHAGTVYVLAYSSHEYEPKTNIIATYRESLVIDL
jgi:hypothetical protein